MKAIIPALISVVALAACSSGGVAFKFYVVVEPDEAAKLLDTVTAIAKANGMETAAGQAVSETGSVLKVVEARGKSLRLWIQNTPQSGQEDPKLCGEYSGSHPDPAQFTVLAEPGFFGSRTAAVSLGERVFAQIKTSGFDARREPVICGAAALPKRQ